MAECMLSSANVLRAGLTHKFRDLDNLLALVSYRQERPYRIAGEESEPGKRGRGSRLGHYSAPGALFGVSYIEISDPTGEIEFAESLGPSFLICVSGRGKVRVGEQGNLGFGSVFYIGCNCSVHI